jgi:AcrR family transcriptional regulator
MSELGDWREYGPAALPRILGAALDAFAERGYAGTSIRDIAAGAGLSVPGVYHHYRSKQQILSELMAAVMAELLERSRLALASAEPKPATQLDALVECLLRFHMYRRTQAFVASTEIRSLAACNRAEYVALRDAQEQMLADVIHAGRDCGAFATEYPQDVARAIATLCVGVATWYRTDGPLSPDQIVARYLTMARALVGA